jgi:hypothetical protein
VASSAASTSSTDSARSRPSTCLSASITCGARRQRLELAEQDHRPRAVDLAVVLEQRRPRVVLGHRVIAAPARSSSTPGRSRAPPPARSRPRRRTPGTRPSPPSRRSRRCRPGWSVAGPLVRELVVERRGRPGGCRPSCRCGQAVVEHDVAGVLEAAPVGRAAGDAQLVAVRVRTEARDHPRQEAAVVRHVEARHDARAGAIVERGADAVPVAQIGGLPRRRGDHADRRVGRAAGVIERAGRDVGAGADLARAQHLGAGGVVDVKP